MRSEKTLIRAFKKAASPRGEAGMHRRRRPVTSHGQHPSSRQEAIVNEAVEVCADRGARIQPDHEHVHRRSIGPDKRSPRMSAPLIVHFNGSQRHACRRWSHALVLLLAILTMLMPARTVEAQGFQPPGGGKSLKDLIKEKVPTLIDPSATPEAPESPKSPGASDAPKEPAPAGASKPGVQLDPVAPKAPAATFAGGRIPIVSVCVGPGGFGVVLADGTVEYFNRLGGDAIGIGGIIRSFDEAVHSLGARVIALAMTEYSIAALCDDGMVRDLFISDSSNSFPTPQICKDPQNPVRRISGGGGHLAAVLADGSVACWGRNYQGQCDVPAGIGTPENPVASVAAGGDHTVALLADGSVACWGANHKGQCDIPASVGRGDKKVTLVSAGMAHTAALLEDGSVICWGDNDRGQCSVPFGIGESGHRVTSVSAGNSLTAVSLDDGSVRAWGATGKPEVAEDLGQGPRRVVRVEAHPSGGFVGLCDDGTIVTTESQGWIADTVGLPKVGVAAITNLGWVFTDGSFQIVPPWRRGPELPPGLGTPDRPIVQVAEGKQGGTQDVVWALLGDGTVVSSIPERLPPKLRDNGRPVVSIHSRYEQLVALREDGSLVGGPLALPSGVKSLRDYGGIPLLLLKDGSLKSIGSKGELVDASKFFPEGIGKVASIVGDGWITRSNGQLVGGSSKPTDSAYMRFPRLMPASAIGSTANPVVAAVDWGHRRGLALLSDGSLVSWDNGSIVFQGGLSIRGNSGAVVRVVQHPAGEARPTSASAGDSGGRIGHRDVAPGWHVFPASV